MKLTPQEMAAIRAHRKKKNKAGFWIFFFLFGMLLLSIIGWALYAGPVDAPNDHSAKQTAIMENLRLNIGNAAAASDSIGQGGSKSEDIQKPASVPDFQKTSQALEKTQSYLGGLAASATSEAKYWEIQVAQKRAQKEIDDIEQQQSVSYTQTAVSLGALETQAVATIEHGKEMMALELQAKSDAVQSQNEKNDIDVSNHEFIETIKTYAITIGIVVSVLIFWFFLYRVTKAAEQNIDWKKDQHQKNQKKMDYTQMANTVSGIMAQKEKEKQLVLKLIAAIQMMGDKHMDYNQVPRFDKLQDGISQPERDQAVDILANYGRCNPRQQGKATRLHQGTFRELQEEIKYGDFPPISRVTSHLQKTYLQQSTLSNSPEQQSTVRKIGEGVYSGN